MTTVSLSLPPYLCRSVSLMSLSTVEVHTGATQWITPINQSTGATTSPVLLSREGWMLMTLWWMTDSVSISMWGWITTRTWTEHRPSWSVSSGGWSEAPWRKHPCATLTWLMHISVLCCLSPGNVEYSLMAVTENFAPTVVLFKCTL